MEHVESRLDRAVRQQEALKERLHALTDRLAELEAERDVLLGETGLAKQAMKDYEQYLGRLHDEMAAARIEEAEAAFQQTISIRDAALEQASLAVEEVATAIGRVDAARENVESARRQLLNLRPKGARTPPEPTDFAERWRVVAPLVERELGRQLETELVEAAARSSNHLVLEKLPEHLQELARQRRRDVLSAARQRRRD